MALSNVEIDRNILYNFYVYMKRDELNDIKITNEKMIKGKDFSNKGAEEMSFHRGNKELKNDPSSIGLADG